MIWGVRDPSIVPQIPDMIKKKMGSFSLGSHFSIIILATIEVAIGNMNTGTRPIYLIMVPETKEKIPAQTP